MPLEAVEHGWCSCFQVPLCVDKIKDILLQTDFPTLLAVIVPPALASENPDCPQTFEYFSEPPVAFSNDCMIIASLNIPEPCLL